MYLPPRYFPYNIKNLGEKVNEKNMEVKNAITTILNSYKGYNYEVSISNVLENYKFHSDTIEPILS